MKLFAKTALLVGISTAITACGGGGGSDSSNANGGTTNPTTPNQPSQSTSISATVVGSGDFAWEEPKAININVLDNNKNVVKAKSCVSDDAVRLTIANDCSNVTVHRLGKSTVTLTGENGLVTKFDVYGTPARLPFSQSTKSTTAHSYVTENGEVKIWGENQAQLPISNNVTANLTYTRHPQTIVSQDNKTLQNIYQVSSTGYSPISYAINRTGKVYIWGQYINAEQTLGKKSWDAYFPIPVKTNETFQKDLDGIVAITSSGRMALAINDEGNVVVIGVKDSSDINGFPRELQGLTDIRQIAINNHYAFAIDKNGTLYKWGVDNYSSDYKKLSKVLDKNGNPITNAKKIVTMNTSQFDDTTLLLTTDGKVYGWGENQTLAGVELSNIKDLIATGYIPTEAIFALTNDGKVLAWGDNSNGKLGVGVDENIKSFIAQPTQVLNEAGSSPLTDIVAISGSGNNGYAVKSDGTVVGWGANFASTTNLKSILTQENDSQSYFKLPVTIYQAKGVPLKLDLSKYTRLN